MPRCNACGNTASFSRSICEYRIQIVSFNAEGHITSQHTEYAQCGREEPGPWLCEACGSDSVDLSGVELPLHLGFR